MKPKTRASDVKRDWNLFFTGGADGLYGCFSDFYDDFYRLGIHWHGNPDLAKECIHNLFLELWEVWDKRPNIENKRQYVLTIYKRICQKTALDYAPTRPVMPPDAYDLQEPAYETVLVAAQANEQLAQRLRQALGRLTKRQKELIRLRYYEERTIAEIADRLSLTERTVYNTLHSAIKLLREILLLACYLVSVFQ